MSNNDFLDRLDALILAYAEERLHVLGAQRPAAPRVASPSSEPSRTRTRSAKRSKRPQPTCPAVLADGSRCGKPGKGPRYQFACPEHVAEHSKAQRQKDYRSFKAGGTAKPAKTARKKRSSKRRTPATKAPKKSGSAPPATAKAVIACPMPGCANPGLRRYDGFCAEHNEKLKTAEKKVALAEKRKRVTVVEPKVAELNAVEAEQTA